MSRERAKGTAWESAVVAYLQEHGFPYAERRAMGGANDRGDIAGVPGVVLECKSTKTLELAEACDEAERERLQDGASYGVAVIKRRNRGVGQAYAVLPLSQLVDLLGEDAP